MNRYRIIRTSDAIGRQLIRSGTSIGANYRAACRAKSRGDVISKMGTVEEETDETLYWLEIVHDLKLSPPPKIEELIREGNELLTITVSSINTARRNKDK